MVRASVLMSRTSASKDNIRISNEFRTSELVMDFWLMLFVLMDTPLVGTFVTKLLPKCGQAKDYLLFIVE